MTDSESTHARELSKRALLRARWSLAILLIVYIFNFIDRQIIGMLAIPIKADLGLTDTELGMMGGVAFALFYTSVGIPVAWLADRKSRVNIIAVSIGLWSAFTASCGAAQNFWHLFLARMGVGLGEAGGVAPSYALIADLFPLRLRGRALAIFALGIPLGSALGIFFGGWLASYVSWRSAFIIVGLAGLVMVPIVKFGIREPPRGEREGHAANVLYRSPSLREALAILVRIRSFWLISLAAASASGVGHGLIFWLPAFFVRSYGLELVEISWFYGSIFLVGGSVGVWSGGWLADRFAVKDASHFALIPAVCLFVSAPVYVAAMFAPNLIAGWLFFVVAQALSLVWASPAMAAVQHVVAVNMRATASSGFLFINNLVGISIGTFFLGWLSDVLRGSLGDDALRYSMVCSLSFSVLAAVLFYQAAKLLRSHQPVGSPNRAGVV